MIPDDTSIEDLDFSVRTYNCLKRVGVNTVGDIKNIDLTKVRNLSRKILMKLKL